MFKSHINRYWVCRSDQLQEGNYRRVNATYAGEAGSILVFRYQSQCMAYRNLCVHMPRELDCEKDMIFDATGQNLRCSMHGIVYDPITGRSISTMCTGQQLTPVRILEDEEGIWIHDKRVKQLELAE